MNNIKPAVWGAKLSSWYSKKLLKGRVLLYDTTDGSQRRYVTSGAAQGSILISGTPEDTFFSRIWVWYCNCCFHNKFGWCPDETESSYKAKSESSYYMVRRKWAGPYNWGKKRLAPDS